MKVQAHAAQFLTGMSEHFTTAAALHKARMDAEEEDTPAHTFHKGMLENCIKTAEGCVAGAKNMLETHKVDAFDADLDSIIPLGVSRIAPSAPRAIPRAGAPPANREPAGDGMLTKVFGFDEEEA